MIGVIAIVLSSISAVPQIIKIYRTKSARDLSMLQCIFLLIGLLCWLLYGIQIGDAVVIAANSICGTLQLTIILMKLFYDSKMYNNRGGLNEVFK